MIKILVIGDIMLDQYTIGTVNRISPEAPVPIVTKTKSYSVLGGCGNVIRNLAELNCQIFCKTMIGEDYFGNNIVHKLDAIKLFDKKFINRSIAYKTTVKHRIIAEHRSTQMIRIDEEVRSPEILFSDDDINFIKESNFNIIIISDYNKGVITSSLMDQVRQLGIPFIVDPKPTNINLYIGAFAITPNEVEYNQIKEKPLESIPKPTYFIKTMGDKGIKIEDTNFNEIAIIKANPVEVFNVSGAGDTVISVLAYCIACGNNIKTSCHIANECAHYVVTKPDTSVVPSELFNTIYIDCGGL